MASRGGPDTGTVSGCRQAQEGSGLATTEAKARACLTLLVAGNADETTSRHRTSRSPGNREVISSAFRATRTCATSGPPESFDPVSLLQSRLFQEFGRAPAR